MKRTAREIEVADIELTNKNISVKIGASENRDAPETVYVYISFWVKPIEGVDESDNKYFKHKLQAALDNIYKPGRNSNIQRLILNSSAFMNEKDNIYIVNIPENFNYNDKSNFISIELYLHTSNIAPGKQMPLNNKKQTYLYKEILAIVNTIGDKIDNIGDIYEVKKKLKNNKKAAN